MNFSEHLLRAENGMRYIEKLREEFLLQESSPVLLIYDEDPELIRECLLWIDEFLDLTIPGRKEKWEKGLLLYCKDSEALPDRFSISGRLCIQAVTRECADEIVELYNVMPSVCGFVVISWSLPEGRRTKKLADKDWLSTRQFVRNGLYAIPDGNE